MADVSGRLVVLGASGFVGSHVVSLAREEGWEAIALASKDVELTSAQASEQLAALIVDGDTIVHAAAVAPSRNASDVVANLLMTDHLAKALAGKQIAQLVVVSSDAVYGSASGVVDEESPTAPDSLHGVMSLGRELICAEAGAPILSLVRPAPIYGIGDTHNSFGHNRFARKVVESGQVRLFGGSSAVRDHVTVGDVARVIVSAASARQAGVINVASGQSVSFAEMANFVVQACDAEGAAVVSAGSEPTPTFRTFDISGLVRRFPGLVPVGPQAGVTQMVHAMMGKADA